MSFEGPHLKNRPGMRSAMYWIDVALTTCFAIEVVVKTGADGLAAYISQLSNQVDFLIVLVSIFLFIFENSSLGFIKGLRTLRAVKPLRTLGRS